MTFNSMLEIFCFYIYHSLSTTNSINQPFGIFLFKVFVCVLAKTCLYPDFFYHSQSSTVLTLQFSPLFFFFQQKNCSFYIGSQPKYVILNSKQWDELAYEVSLLIFHTPAAITRPSHHPMKPEPLTKKIKIRLTQVSSSHCYVLSRQFKPSKINQTTSPAANWL